MRYLSLLLLVFGLCSQPAMADNPMKTIFSDMMTNSTQPTTFSTAKRFGATGVALWRGCRRSPPTSSRWCRPR